MERNPLPQRDLQPAEPQREGSGDHSQRHFLRILRLQLARVRRDQAVLVQEFVDRCGGKLLGLATRMVGRQDAADVAQDAFVNLVRWIQNKPVPAAMALLRSSEELWRLQVRFTSCRARDHLRRKYNRTVDLGHDGGEVEAVDDPATPRSEESLQIRRVARAYAALPPAQRIAHVLHHYYGFTDSEFEATLGLKKSYSRALVRRANLALKRAMEMKP